MRWYWRVAISMAVAGWVTFTVIALPRLTAPSIPWRTNVKEFLTALPLSPLLVPPILLAMLLDDRSPLDLRFALASGSYFVTGLLCYAVTHYLFPNRREQKKGYCAVCGYDLRATPNRCPECGAIVP